MVDDHPETETVFPNPENKTAHVITRIKTHTRALRLNKVHK